MSTARQTLTLLKAKPQLEIKRYDGESDSHYERRCASIRALGERWLRHPAYVFQPRHSVHTNVWAAARQDFLAEISDRARADRLRNIAHQDAERARAALPRPTT